MKTVESKVLTADDKNVNREFQKELAFIRDTSKEVDKLDTQIVVSLIRIRDEKLYRGMYKSFEDACRAELRIEKSEWSRKLIAVEAAEAIKTSPKGEVLLKELDLNRAQILELANNTDDVESQVKVLQHIKDSALEPTAKLVKSVCDELLPPTNASQEEKAEKKRAAAAERKRLAEESRAAKAEEKRLAAEKKAAEKAAAKQAREAAKRASGEAPSEPVSQFNPETFEENRSELPDAKLRQRIEGGLADLADNIRGDLKLVERTMNEVDAFHSKTAMSNHKAFCATFHRIHNELTTAIETAVQWERAWKAGTK
jgi:hypothetical protein